MLADISSVDAIYIVCGRTDMRKSIDGLCAIIQEQFSMEIDHALFLFCGRKCDRIKAILKEPDGIVMIYKRLTAQGSYRWARNKSEVRNLTWREFDWLMSGIDIEQPKAIKATSVSYTHLEIKTSCVRIKYADGYHIDFAVYRRHYDSENECWIYEHAGSDWSESCLLYTSRCV